MVFYNLMICYFKLYILIKFLLEDPLKNGFCRRATRLKRIKYEYKDIAIKYWHNYYSDTSSVFDSVNICEKKTFRLQLSNWTPIYKNESMY